MPLAHRIDHRPRLVIARASGTLTDEEVFAYQKDVWSRPDVAGYDELVDMTAGRRRGAGLAPVDPRPRACRGGGDAASEALGLSRE